MRSLPVLCLLALSCAGCANAMLGSTGDAPEVYRLDVDGAAGTAARLPVVLGVARPRAMASLDTERIAVVQPGNRFDYYAGVRWSEPAPQMLQGLVIRALHSAGRYQAVIASPSRVPADLLLDVELRRFEAVYPVGGEVPAVRVEMQAVLADPLRARRLGGVLASAEVRAEANRRPEILAAFERATAEAVGEVAAWLGGVEPPVAE